VIAALYVQRESVYSDLPDVDLWGIERDARLYPGPWPVVAHPPCQRWGRYWSGGPKARQRRRLGDDGGCFVSGLVSVRRFGGVLEHPHASYAWREHGLLPPRFGGGWSEAGDGVGWTCCVEQGHYGYWSRKATWLYAAHVELPELEWGPSVAFERGVHELSRRQRSSTPKMFRDVLVNMARSSL